MKKGFVICVILLMVLLSNTACGNGANKGQWSNQTDNSQ